MKSTDSLTRLFGVLAIIAMSADESRASETLTFREGDGGAYSSTHGATVSWYSGGGGQGSETLLWVSTYAIEWYKIGYIAFPDIIGTNPGQIPPGSTIESATLQLTRANDSELSTSFELLTSTWDENTINFANRPTVGPGVGMIPAGPAGDYVIDVSSSVAAWSQGTGNWGFMMATPISDLLSSQSFYSDDAPDLATRPLLTVTFSSPSVPVESSTWGKIKARYR